MTDAVFYTLAIVSHLIFGSVVFATWGVKDPKVTPLGSLITLSCFVMVVYTWVEVFV